MSEESAEKIFSYLSRRYNIIGLNDFIDAHESRDNTQLPKKALILTFDDGHIGNYALLPVIRKTRIPVTIFLCASIVNTNRHFWFNYEGLSLSVPDIKRNVRSWYRDLSEYGFIRDREFASPQALQKSQIEEMMPLINFQSHTMYHPILPRCSGVEAEQEIMGSKEILMKNFGLPVNAISYPNGDYSERDILLVKEAGYKCGMTVDFGYNTIQTDLFRLRRLSLSNTDDMNEIIVKASGLWAFLKTVMG